MLFCIVYAIHDHVSWVSCERGGTIVDMDTLDIVMPR